MILFFFFSHKMLLGVSIRREDSLVCILTKRAEVLLLLQLIHESNLCSSVFLFYLTQPPKNRKDHWPMFCTRVEKL